MIHVKIKMIHDTCKDKLEDELHFQNIDKIATECFRSLE